MNKSNGSNINIAYSELAKQLKSNKHSTFHRNKTNYTANNSNTDTNTDNNINGINSYQQSDKILTKPKNSPAIGFTKTTKDNSITSLRMSCSMPKLGNVDLEGPEELHFFNVGIFQNNKRHAHKFEQGNSDGNSIINDEL